MFWRVPGFLQSSNQHMSFGQRSMSCVVPIGAARPIPRHEEVNSPLHKASPSEDEVHADNKSSHVLEAADAYHTTRQDGGEESGAACRAAGGGAMVGARRAGGLGAGACGRDVLAAGARARGLLHRL